MNANQALVDLLGRIAKNKNATSAQIAIRVAPRAEAVDCAHPRYYKAPPA
jgi:hypothetical protein